MTGTANDVLKAGAYPVERGGTGGIDPASARANLLAAASGVNADLTSVSALNHLLGATFTGPSGETALIQFSEELLTLSTSGTTTDTTANLLPAGSLILAVCGRVTTTITTATDWKLGDPTSAGRFSAVDSTMTAGETVIGIVQWSGAISTLALGPSQAAAAKVRVTTTGTPGAGAIRITVAYIQLTGPTA